MVCEGSRAVSGVCHLWAGRTSKHSDLGGCSGSHFPPNPTLPAQPDSQGSEESLSRKHKCHRYSRGMRNPEAQVSLGRAGTAGLCQRGGSAQERSWVSGWSIVLLLPQGSFCKKDLCDTSASHTQRSWHFKPVKLNCGIKTGQELGLEVSSDPSRTPQHMPAAAAQKISSCPLQNLVWLQEGNTDFAWAFNDLKWALGFPPPPFYFLRCFSAVDEWMKHAVAETMLQAEESVCGLQKHKGINLNLSINNWRKEISLHITSL